MKADVKTCEGLKREVSVVVPSKDVQEEMEKRFSQIRKETALKGFRKGHAPMDMIKSLYGEKVKFDTADHLITESLTEAVNEHNLRIASRPNVMNMDFTDSGDFEYTVDVEIFPEIAKVDYKGVKLDENKIEVSDKDVDDALEYYRRQLSELRVLNREAKDGDIVIADLVKLNDPSNALDESEFPNSTIDLGSQLTVKEFKEHLPGCKSGDEKEIEVLYDKDYADPRFAGACIKYACKIKTINERILPELNDEFAKRTTIAETALELKLRIREGISNQKQEEKIREDKQAIVMQVCKKNDIPVPEGLLNSYLDNMVEEVHKESPEVKADDIRKQYREVGANSMRWDMLWRRLAEQEKIEVLPEDTEKWINGFAAHNRITVEQAQENLRNSKRIGQLRESLLEEKVLKFLIDSTGK